MALSESVRVGSNPTSPANFMFDKITKFLKEHKLEGNSEFHPGAMVDVDNRRVEILLEDVAYYAEWIKGEGADISIYRAMDDNRVIGGVFELREWKGQFPISIYSSSFS